MTYKEFDIQVMECVDKLTKLYNEVLDPIESDDCHFNSHKAFFFDKIVGIEEHNYELETFADLFDSQKEDEV